jgi:GntR family transcriptional repressor for pyruvate dehydrogenase complex
MFKPVERKSLSDAVFEQLRNQIVSGEMEPGSALPSERVLCEMLDVNRGAVREALKRLDQARLISIQHGGATRVLDFRETAGTDLLAELLMKSSGDVDFEVARSIMELRTALGSDIARRCAASGPGVAVSLRDIIAEMRANKRDVETLQRLDMAFWQAVVLGSENIAYQLAFNSIRDVHERFGAVMSQIMNEELRDIDAHERISEAIEAGNGEEAELEARHLLARGEARVRAVAERMRENNIKGGQHGD